MSNHTFTGYLEDDRGNEHELSVNFDFQPAEPMVRYPNDDAYPGAEAEIELCEVMVGKEDILEHLTDDEADRREQQCWDYLETLDEGR